MLQFKLDENIDPRWREPLEQAGHGVSTVGEESLHGAEDDAVVEACQEKDLCLITADLDFAQIVDYPPDRYPGLIILRYPRPTLAGLLGLIHQIVIAAEKESPVGRLWIVEPGRVRVHQRDPETS